jgi:preprotein translocase subunit SecA
VKGFMEWAGIGDEVPIEHSLVGKAIENAQVRVEGYHFEIRKHLVDYDDVVNKHREVVYGERKRILSSTDLKVSIQSMIQDELQDLVAAHLGDGQPDIEGLLEEVNRILPLSPELNPQALSQMRPEEIETRLMEHAEALYEAKERDVGQENMRLLERLVMLRTLDNLWMEHLTMMEEMRQEAGWQSMRQMRAVDAYRIGGYDRFQNLRATLQHDVVHSIYHVSLVKKEAATPLAAASQREAVPAGKKVGRNDPCPCGSGKKYKRCCGK